MRLSFTLISLPYTNLFRQDNEKRDIFIPSIAYNHFIEIENPIRFLHQVLERGISDASSLAMTNHRNLCKKTSGQTVFDRNTEGHSH